MRGRCCASLVQTVLLYYHLKHFLFQNMVFETYRNTNNDVDALTPGHAYPIGLPFDLQRLLYINSAHLPSLPHLLPFN